MATQATYCTERDLKDIFPEVDSYDTKTPVYGWVSTDTTNQYQANNTGLITQLYFDGIKGTSVSDNPNATYEYNYSSTTDSVQVFHSSNNPNDMLMESGEDYATLKTRYMKNASEWLDSRLDGTLPRERFKDQDGNYDYIIVRTSALLAAVFLIRSQDPTSEVASALFDEATVAIDKINDGQTKLSWQTTRDDSQGVVRQTSDTGNLRIIDTRGNYIGIYDKIGVRITTAGAMGTAKYSVWSSDGDKIGTEIMAETSGATTTDADITEVVDGMYQSLAGGLQIRFAGDTGDTAVVGDAWEIEVTGKYEVVDNARPKHMKMTRGGGGSYNSRGGTAPRSATYPPNPRPSSN